MGPVGQRDQIGRKRVLISIDEIIEVLGDSGNGEKNWHGEGENSENDRSEYSSDKNKPQLTSSGASGSEKTDSELPTEIETLVSKWEKHQKRLVMFLHHEDINELEFSITQFRRAAEFGDYEAAVQNADRIRCLFKMIREHDEVTVRNIL